MTKSTSLSVLSGLSLLLNVSLADPVADDPVVQDILDDSVLTVMIAKITPASDALWGVDQPNSDAEWQDLVVAADDVIAAFELIRNGGSGPNDNQWAQDTKWQDYTDEIIAAANSAKIAANNQDIDALFQANEALYTPCEACHIDFNPGVGADN